MDINDVRSLFTVVFFIGFIGVVWWAFGPKRKQHFDDQGQIPFEDDQHHKETVKHEK